MRQSVLKQRRWASQGEPVTVAAGRGPSKHKVSEDGARSLASSEREGGGQRGWRRVMEE